MSQPREGELLRLRELLAKAFEEMKVSLIHPYSSESRRGKLYKEIEEALDDAE